MFTKKSFQGASVGLLASQCCVIQLVFNYLSLPCAGFALLSPYRPFFLVLVVLFTLTTFYRSPLQWRSTLVIILTLMLTFTPEMVDYANRHMTPEITRMRMLEFHVQGIKCDACAHRIKQTVQRLPHVTGVTVDYKEHKLLVRMNQAEHVQLTSDKIAWQLRGLAEGYDAHFINSWLD
jgi:copper chaperone CopZ